MGKYIIDTETWANLFEVQSVGVYGIGNDIVTDEKTVWSRMFRLDELEELNSDYINEHFGELQDEAYERGYDDGRRKARSGCTGCKYEGNTGKHLPCEYCTNNFMNQWTAKQKDRIEVGDEVQQVTNSGTPTGLVCTVTAFDGEKMSGFAQDGRFVVCSSQVNRWWKKTGRHYDIQSILEAMKQ